MWTGVRQGAKKSTARQHGPGQGRRLDQNGAPVKAPRFGEWPAILLGGGASPQEWALNSGRLPPWASDPLLNVRAGCESGSLESFHEGRRLGAGGHGFGEK